MIIGSQSIKGGKIWLSENIYSCSNHNSQMVQLLDIIFFYIWSHAQKLVLVKKPGFFHCRMFCCFSFFCSKFFFEIKKAIVGKTTYFQIHSSSIRNFKVWGNEDSRFQKFCFFWAGTLRLLLLLKKSVLFFLNDGLGASHIDIVKSSTFVSTVNFVGWWDN